MSGRMAGNGMGAQGIPWSILREFDFEAMVPQQFVADGNYLLPDINGVNAVWGKYGTVHENAPAAIVAGRGLVLYPAGDTTSWIVTHEAPQLFLQLQQFAAELTPQQKAMRISWLLGPTVGGGVNQWASFGVNGNYVIDAAPLRPEEMVGRGSGGAPVDYWYHVAHVGAAVTQLLPWPSTGRPITGAPADTQYGTRLTYPLGNRRDAHQWELGTAVWTDWHLWKWCIPPAVYGYVDLTADADQWGSWLPYQIVCSCQDVTVGHVGTEIVYRKVRIETKNV